MKGFAIGTLSLALALAAASPALWAQADHQGHSMDHSTMEQGAAEHGTPGSAETASPENHTMDHGTMDHGAADQSTMDHGTMDHGTMDHGSAAQRAGKAEAQAGQDHSGHAGHAMGPAATRGPWAYHDRDNPRPFTRNRWEMVPVPGYGHLYVNDADLAADVKCAALRENPRIMVDRATRRACGMPERPQGGTTQGGVASAR